MNTRVCLRFERAVTQQVRSRRRSRAILIAVPPFVDRKKPKHFGRRIRALWVGIRTGRIAPEPGMTRPVHQPLLGEDATLRVLQPRPSIGIPTGNDAPLNLLVVALYESA